MAFWEYLFPIWAVFSSGTFFFCTLLAYKAFATPEGREGFKKLNIRLSTLVICVILGSILFPFAWKWLSNRRSGA